MDEERRLLVRRLAADPLDPVAGPALARLLSRSQVTGELVPGRAALVLRPSTPRPAFAWRAAMDKAVGRVCWVRSVAKDGLSYEIEVADVGRFHVGAASLAPLPELGKRQASGTFEALDGSVGPQRGVGRSIADLRRMGELPEDEPGTLGPDGLTHAQRLLLDAVPQPLPGELGEPVVEVAARAGFTAENNRTSEGALAYLWRMCEQNPRVRRPLVTIEAPILLPGATFPGSVDSGAWQTTDLLVARLPGATELVRGLPWAVIAGIQTDQVHAPPHAPVEVANALLRLLANPRAGLDEISVIEGPDFPGGGEAGTRGDIGRLYATGSGSLRLRAAVHFGAPARVFIKTPWPDERSVFEQAVNDAVRFGRLDGVEPTSVAGELGVELARGAEPSRLETVKEELMRLLPIEQEISYGLPSPLVPWLRSFLEDKVRSGLDAREIRRLILDARQHGGEGRRTRIF